MLAALLVVLCCPRQVSAHGVPLPLATWGDFGDSPARCQRVLGDAATQCALEVWAARRACIEPQLAGGGCDANGTAAAVRDARQRALDKVGHYCSEADLTALHFLGSAEALADVTSICRQLENSLVSAAYGPALFDTLVLPVDDPTRTCLEVGASTAEQMLRLAARTERTPLDRIAAQPMTLMQKNDQVGRAQRRVSAARTSFAARITERCPADRFGRVYGRGIDTFVADLAARGTCLAGGVYVQNALLCPPPQCGNGMVESPEQCDVGAGVDASWCGSDCTRSDCDVYAGTYDLIQQAIFENHGCTDDACHGSTAGGGLDLSADVSYANLVGVPSTSSAQKRVAPGDAEQSRLWLLLAKATLGRADVPGRPMPPDPPPLSAAELEVLRLWIAADAPRRGTVAGTGELLGACLPAPR